MTMTPRERFLARRKMTADEAAGKVSAKSGKVAGELGSQHQDMYRKIALRRRLLRFMDPGPIYVPFIGDGDIAVELYNDRRVIGADLDPQRVQRATERLNDCIVMSADCDGWPISQQITAATKFVAADFDAYSYPYHAMRSFLDNARKADHLVVYFTDGMRMGILRSTAKKWHHPAGHMVDKGDTNSKRKQWSSYWMKICKPWFTETVREHGYMVTTTAYYTRGAGMLYWGAVLDRK